MGTQAVLIYQLWKKVWFLRIEVINRGNMVKPENYPIIACEWLFYISVIIGQNNMTGDLYQETARGVNQLPNFNHESRTE